jgi:hypothetical protein
MRSKPKKNKQTRATKASAMTFGKASKVVNKILPSFKPVISALITRRSRNLFVAAFNKWLHTDPLNTVEPLNDINPVTGFQFNEQTSLKERLRLLLNISRTAGDTLLLSIPAFDPVEAIIAPANTVMVEMCVVAGSCYMHSANDPAETCNATIEIDYTDGQQPAQQLELPVKTGAGYLCLVMVALKYTISRKGNTFVTNDLRWMPAGIVSAFYN